MTDDTRGKPVAPALPGKKIRKPRVIKTNLEGEGGRKKRGRKRLPIKEVEKEILVDGTRMIVTVFQVQLGPTETFLPTKKAATKALREWQKAHKPKKSRRLKMAIALKKKWEGVSPEKEATEELLDLEKEVEVSLEQYIDGAKTRGYVK